MLTICILAMLSALSACSKKAPEPAQDAKPAEAAAEAPKANVQAAANEEKPAEAALEPPKAPEPDDNHTDLALDKECVVTHCKNYKGPGHYWLDCDTDDIVEAGFGFGDKVAAINYKKGKPVYRVHIQGRGDNCVTQGHYADKCFVDQGSYIKYITDNQLICNYEDDGTTCIYDDDEHKKCRSKKLKFAFPNFKNTWADKADADLTKDELEAKYISFWGKRIGCDLENDEGGYACKGFVNGEFCHCNNKGDCYCPDGDPVTAGEFPPDSCTKNVCNPLKPKDCREVMTACPDDEADIDEDEDDEPWQALLAINPKDCTVTHCKDFTGFENNGLACDTDNIVEADFVFGDTVYRVGHFVHDNACNPQGEEWDKCFLKKQDFQNYIKSQKLDCKPGKDKECLYENEDWCK